MSRSTPRSSPSEDQIVSALTRRAVELWGAQRARSIQRTIAQAAGNVRRLADDLPDAAEEPAFYL